MLHTLLALALAAAAPSGPVPVRDDPHVVERAPASRGAWVGWVKDTDYYVQSWSQRPIRMNVRGTHGLGGDISGLHVFYLQQRGDDDPRIVRFDLGMGRRTALPPRVNHDVRAGRVHGVRGQVTASGKWLLYSGFIEPASDFDYPDWTVMLYNRSTRELRQVAGAMSDWSGFYAGQVNGRYATYWNQDPVGASEIYRYDIRTGRSVEVRSAEGGYDPAVSADGTVYYFVNDDSSDATDLVRKQVGSPTEIVTTLTGAGRPDDTYVRDRADGSHVVFFQWLDDVYKIVSAGDGGTRGLPRP